MGAVRALSLPGPGGDPADASTIRASGSYLVDHGYLGAELAQRIVEDALTLVRALGYDMNSIEFAVRDGVPYAIDFMNPAPDMDINSLTPTYFEWTVKKMADMAIELAQKPRPQSRALKWDAAFTARR